MKQSLDSDLQYVSIELDGQVYGGWYRMLADGQMELLALANMHSELRPEGTPLEQARGMLADFIRTARSKSDRVANRCAEPMAAASQSQQAQSLELHSESSHAVERGMSSECAQQLVPQVS